MGLILQYLSNKTTLNQLFMVDVTKLEEAEIIHEENDLIENQEQEVKDKQYIQISMKRKDLLDLQMHLQLVNEA